MVVGNQFPTTLTRKFTTMKKIFLFMVAATLSLAIGGCSSDDDLAPASTNIAVTATDTDFEAFGGEGTIYIDTDATSIEATSNANWLTITEAYSASKDGKAWVSFVVDKNLSDIARTATVTICTGARDCQTTITQQGAAMVITEVTSEFSATGGAGSMIVETSVEGLEATSDSEWLTIGAIEGSVVNYTAAVNATASERTAVVTLTLGTVSRVVNIKQSGATLTIVESKLDFENGGGKGEILLETTFPEVTVEENADWLTIDTNSTQKITYTVAQNTTTQPRNTTITIVAGEIRETLTISQKCASLTVVETPAEFYGLGGNGRITINCDAPTVTATADVDWITIVQANPEAVYFTVGRTPLASSREGTITIKANDLTQTVTIKQAAASLDIIPNVTTYTADAATGDFGVTIPTSALKVSSDADWVTFGEPTESGFTYSLAANTTGADRTATITVTLSDEVSKTFTLTQKFWNYDYFVGSYTLTYNFGTKGTEDIRTKEVTIEKDPDAARAAEGWYRVYGMAAREGVPHASAYVAMQYKGISGVISLKIQRFDNHVDDDGSVHRLSMYAYMAIKDSWYTTVTGQYGFDFTFNGDAAAPAFSIDVNEYTKNHNDGKVADNKLNEQVTGILFRVLAEGATKETTWGRIANFLTLEKK